MCGISAVVSTQHVRARGEAGVDAAIQKEQLKLQMQASLDKIKHRGPDSSGIWINKDLNIVLGHNRLAINDLSESGAQPFHSPYGKVHAIVNGELYGYQDLKQDLSQTYGFHFISNSDSEIVIALYQAHGLDFVHHLRGEFALCLYDETQRLFIAARDQYGIKPLFYTHQDGRLLVAAEVKAFLPLDWQPEWDVTSIVEGGWNFDDRTLFKGVHKVRPGHYLTCDPNGRVEQHQYWDMEFPNKTQVDRRSEDELVASVRDRLVESIRLRLRADVPVGVYLSGGIDSSVIAGIVAHLVKEQSQAMGSLPASERVSCFSVAFEKTSGFDESDVAERTAQYLGVKQYKKYMDEEALSTRFSDATYHCEHHNADLNYIGKFALSELPQDHGFKVVLTGEGADEVMTGYGVFLPDFLREPDLTWPDAMPEKVRLKLLETSETETKQYYKSIGAKFQIAETIKQKLNNISTPASMAAFHPDVFTQCPHSYYSPQDTIAADISTSAVEKIEKRWHPVNSAQYIWSKGHLPNQFMSCLGDRTEMAHSIEGRTPFLDHHFTEFVNTIPPSLKVRWKGHGDEMTAKWILREACKQFVTPEVYERAKHPYSAPTTYAEDGPLHQLLSGLITENKVRQLGFVSWEKSKDLIHRAFVDKDVSAARLAFVVAQWVVLAERFGIKTASQ